MGTDTKIFLLYTILLCTVVALVILFPAACLAPRKRDQTPIRNSLEKNQAETNLDIQFMRKKFSLRNTGNIASFDSDMKEILQDIPRSNSGLITLKSDILVSENDLKDILNDSLFYRLKNKSSTQVLDIKSSS